MALKSELVSVGAAPPQEPLFPSIWTSNISGAIWLRSSERRATCLKAGDDDPCVPGTSRDYSAATWDRYTRHSGPTTIRFLP